MKTKKLRMIYIMVSLALAMSFFLIGVYSSAYRQVLVNGSLAFNAKNVWVDYNVEKSNAYEGNLFSNADFSARSSVGQFTSYTNPTAQTGANGWDQSLNGSTNSQANSWGGFNGGVPGAGTGYHAHLIQFEGQYVYRFVNAEGRWLGISQGGLQSKIEAGKTYNVSFDIYNDGSLGHLPHGGFYYSLTGGGSTTFHSGSPVFSVSKTKEWQTVSMTYTIRADANLSSNVSFYLYGYQGDTGADKIIYMKNPVLNEVSYTGVANGRFDEDQSTKIANVGDLDLSDHARKIALKVEFTRQVNFTRNYYVKVSNLPQTSTFLKSAYVNNPALVSDTGLFVSGNSVEIVIYLEAVETHNFSANQSLLLEIYIDLSLDPFT